MANSQLFTVFNADILNVFIKKKSNHPKFIF